MEGEGRLGRTAMGFEGASRRRQAGLPASPFRSSGGSGALLIALAGVPKRSRQSGFIRSELLEPSARYIAARQVLSNRLTTCHLVSAIRVACPRRVRACVEDASRRCRSIRPDLDRGETRLFRQTALPPSMPAVGSLRSSTADSSRVSASVTVAQAAGGASKRRELLVPNAGI